MAFYFSSVTKALYDTDVFPVASLPANKVEISEAVYTELLTKQNQGYVILADGSGNPYTVNQSEASATDIKHAASVATTLALGHVKIGNTMTAANDGTLDVKDDAITADKVKDNETLPVNISGSADSAQTLPRCRAYFTSSEKGYKNVAILEAPGETSDRLLVLEVLVNQAGGGGATFKGILSVGIRNNSGTYVYGASYVGRDTPPITLYVRYSTSSHRILIYAGKNNSSYCSLILISRGVTSFDGNLINGGVILFDNPGLEDISSYPNVPISSTICPSIGGKIAVASSNGVGDPSTPVYVDPNGQVKPCDASPFIIDKMVKEDGTDFAFYESIPFAVGYDEGFKTIGKLNISPSNKNCIIDITFMLRSFNELEENDNSEEIPAATFAVFVGNTEISTYYLQGSIPHLDPNFNSYYSSPSFRCTFSANINNTIYIKVKKTSYYARKLDLYDIKVQGLAFYTN